MLSREAFVEKYQAEVPRDFLRDALVGLADCYRATKRNIGEQDFDAQQAAWALPYNRRGAIETRIRRVAEKYADEGVSVDVHRAKGNNCFYCQISVGQFKFTVSAAKGGCDLPRPADYRAEKSLANYNIFAGVDDQGGQDAYYGILIHEPNSADDAPQSVRMVFPDESYTTVLYSIDLLELFDGLIAADTPPQEVAEEPELKLRVTKGGREAVG